MNNLPENEKWTKTRERLEEARQILSEEKAKYSVYNEGESDVLESIELAIKNIDQAIEMTYPDSSERITFPRPSNDPQYFYKVVLVKFAGFDKATKGWKHSAEKEEDFGDNDGLNLLEARQAAIGCYKKLQSDTEYRDQFIDRPFGAPGTDLNENMATYSLCIALVEYYEEDSVSNWSYIIAGEDDEEVAESRDSEQQILKEHGFDLPQYDYPD